MRPRSLSFKEVATLQQAEGGLIVTNGTRSWVHQSGDTKGDAIKKLQGVDDTTIRVRVEWTRRAIAHNKVPYGLYQCNP